MMRRMGTKKGVARTHFYPLAMATYEAWLSSARAA